jgi:hypothetical protein
MSKAGRKRSPMLWNNWGFSAKEWKFNNIHNLGDFNRWGREELWILFSLRSQSKISAASNDYE